MAYTVDEIKKIINKKLSDLKIGERSKFYLDKNDKYKELYQLDCVNYKSKIGDTYISDIIAQCILEDKDFKCEHLASFYNESNIRGGDDYPFSFKNHNPSVDGFEKDTEKVVCRKLYANGFFNEHIGKIKEYEVNLILSSKRNIDLISLNGDNNEIYLIEVKGNLLPNQNDETLLRCILEVETYYQIINKVRSKFISQFLKIEGIDIDKYAIKKAVLLFEGEKNTTKAWSDYIKIDERPYVKKLLEKWNIEVFSFSESDVKNN